MLPDMDVCLAPGAPDPALRVRREAVALVPTTAEQPRLEHLSHEADRRSPDRTLSSAGCCRAWFISTCNVCSKVALEMIRRVCLIVAKPIRPWLANMAVAVSRVFESHHA